MKAVLCSVLALALTASMAVASTFETCPESSERMGYNIFDLPSTFVPGRAGDISFYGTSAEQLPAGGKLTMELFVLGVSIKTQTYDLCSVLAECNVAANEPFTGKLSFAVPAEVPVGTEYTFDFIVTNAEGEEISCVELGDIDMKDAELIRGGQEFSHPRFGFDEEEVHYLFTQWMQQHSISYQTAEEKQMRMGIFKENLIDIAIHNAAQRKNEHDYTKGMNQFGHLTADEFREKHLGFDLSLKPKELKFVGVNNDFSYDGIESSYLRSSSASRKDTVTDTPASVDWTTKGAVTPVKNQGSCGSCWSFSTTGAVEGAYFLKYGKLVSFSEQDLVSCDKVDSGCNGGLMDNAFDWIERNGGLCTEADYPYISGSGQTARCKKNSCKIVPNSKPSSYVDVKKNTEALAAAVAITPVAIAIEADQMAFQFYKKGVMTGRCGVNLDHGVLLVGYGTEAGKDFWKVKNSWGPTWGAKGYIQLGKGMKQRGGQCGILESASYPVFK